MNQADAYRVLLARAIETEDRDASLLSEPQRRQIERAAGRAPAAPGTGEALSRDEEDYLARRARLLLAALQASHPAVAQAIDRPPGRAWISIALPLAAFVAGAALHDAGTGHAINILAFPLLGMLLWNLAVYAALALGRMRRPATAPGHLRRGLRSLAARWVSSASAIGLPRSADAQGVLARAALRFAADWLRQGAPVAAAQAARMLHLAAAALAAGAVAGMYLRGLAFEYRAGWESTFLDAESVRHVVGTILAPASALSGIALPQSGQWEALRLSPLQPGENAARWIHLYALTTGLFIVVPRLLLAFAARLKERRYRADFPLPSRSDRYFARLLGAHPEVPRKLRLLTYSYHPPAAARDNLRLMMTRVFGTGAILPEPEVIAYGEEDRLIEDAAAASGPAADVLLVVFNLAATPEKEVHGRLCDGLGDLVAAGRVARHLLLLLDASAYRARLAGEAGSAQRIEQRRSAWSEALAGHDLVMIDLGAADADAGMATDLLQAVAEGAA